MSEIKKKFKLQNVRLSFPSLFKKAVFQGDETKFEATLLLKKEDSEKIVAEMRKSIQQLIKTELKVEKIPSDKICLKDGDDSTYEGYDGCWSLKAANKTRPIVIDRDRSPLTEDDNKIYAGCYVNAMIEFWVQDNGYGKRINANLLGVQFNAHGEPFGDGGTRANADDFDLFEDDTDDAPF